MRIYQKCTIHTATKLLVFRELLNKCNCMRYFILYESYWGVYCNTRLQWESQTAGSPNRICIEVGHRLFRRPNYTNTHLYNFTQARTAHTHTHAQQGQNYSFHLDLCVYWMVVVYVYIIDILKIKILKNAFMIFWYAYFIFIMG